MSTQPKAFLTPEEYLAIERKAEFKSEYYQGEMYSMSGPQRAYNLIAMNAGAALHRQLRSRQCEVYPSDMRVRVSSTGLYTYPDALVVCDEPQFADGEVDTLLNPALIVEVLSLSTEAYDRGFKFDLYKSIESLQDYLLISSVYMHTDLFTRQTDGRWVLTSCGQPEEIVQIHSVGCNLKLADLYEKVQFEPSPRRRMRPLNPA